MHPVPQMACSNKKEKFGFGNNKRHPVMGAFLCFRHCIGEVKKPIGYKYHGDDIKTSDGFFQHT